MLLPVTAPATSAVLVGVLDVSPAYQYADVWGWQDPATHRLYALVGNNATGLHIVDTTDPANPFAVSTVTTVPRFDMKTRGSLVYCVDGLANPGKILDIAQPANPVVVGSFPGGHNVVIDDEGYLYVCLPGLRIFDLGPDPAQPVLVWEDPLSDGNDGHDATVIGDTLYEFRGAYGVRFWDVTNRSAPVLLGAIEDSTIAYAHNGWPTEDGHYLFVTDEMSRDPVPDITVWDISEFSAPQRVAEIGDPTSSVHNCYVVGDFLFVAYYTAGFKVFDVSDPVNPVLADAEDTSAFTGEGNFDGAFGCYPFSPDGCVYINDRPNGLFVFRIENIPTSVHGSPARPPLLTLESSAPNPFGTATTVRYVLATPAEVSAAVYDAVGRRVRWLDGAPRPPGEHNLVWDGRNDSGVQVPSGVYFCRVRAGGVERTTRLVLLR